MTPSVVDQFDRWSVAVFVVVPLVAGCCRCRHHRSFPYHTLMTTGDCDREHRRTGTQGPGILNILIGMSLGTRSNHFRSVGHHLRAVRQLRAALLCAAHRRQAYHRAWIHFRRVGRPHLHLRATRHLRAACHCLRVRFLLAGRHLQAAHHLRAALHRRAAPHRLVAHHRVAPTRQATRQITTRRSRRLRRRRRRHRRGILPTTITTQLRRRRCNARRLQRCGPMPKGALLSFLQRCVPVLRFARNPPTRRARGVVGGSRRRAAAMRCSSTGYCSSKNSNINSTTLPPTVRSKSTTSNYIVTIADSRR